MKRIEYLSHYTTGTSDGGLGYVTDLRPFLRAAHPNKVAGVLSLGAELDCSRNSGLESEKLALGYLSGR